MPISRKRKKRSSPAPRREETEAYSESGVTLQDLINIVAYQEYVKNGTIVPQGETIIHISEPEDEEQE